MDQARTPEALDAAQAAALLGIDVETIRRLARLGELPSVKRGKLWRFKRSALLRWVKTAAGRTKVRTAAGRTKAKTQKNSSPRVEHQPPIEGANVVPHTGTLSIVGIGASAGGLEALELFMRGVPDKSGLAFVVVQHLDPTHKGMMVELLQRATPMKVLQARDRQEVEPNRVYVIPPNKDLSILHGVLHLLVPAAPRGHRLAIDFFFRSLAADQKSRSIGVILSGMGSDGTLGLGAIKEHGGAVFVQEPASAKFDSMPRSAVDAGIADVVAPVEELAAKILAYRSPARGAFLSDLPPAPRTQSAVEKVCILVRNETGHDFSQYKRSTVYRRIERRVGLHSIDGIAAYVRYLQENPQETQLLFKELLIGVTNFFRDSPAWEYLKTKAIPALLSERPAGSQIRAWITGCSTGEEAYSLAIVFKEVLAQASPSRNYTLQVFATDLDKEAIERARQGVYPTNISGDVSTERLRRYFVKEPQGFRVSQEIRETVIFATQNVVMDPPFTKLDILICRNLLIYLAPELQQKLIPLFHYSLNPGGVLFLGSAETLGASPQLFAPQSQKVRIFRRLDGLRSDLNVEFPSAFRDRPVVVEPRAAAKSSAPNLQTLAEQHLLARYSPAAVLTNEQGDILYVSGRTGNYLEPAAGKANWNIHAMAREGLRYELSGAFQKALRQPRTVAQAQVKVESIGAVRYVDVTIEPLQQPEALRGMVMVVFTNTNVAPLVMPAGKTGQTSIAAEKRERDIQRVRAELLTTREEMQSSQEELKSANEEMQSMNEELQSTNEELTTSKEELQSLNEELQTLNHELQAKLDELARTNDDMRNLLDSTNIATLFLDNALNVRRFTAQMTKLVKLIPGDVNRPITDLASDLIYTELVADAGTVLQSLVFKERAVKTSDGRWFAVRIMPYRTLDNRINGVVITFIDITAAKMLEATLRHNRAEVEPETAS